MINNCMTIKSIQIWQLYYGWLPCFIRKKMSYYVPGNITVILAFIIFVFYLLGIQQILTSYPRNDCEMTFMFQYPQFVEISLPPNILKAYPKYTLYGYAEGELIGQLREMKFKGIPVLFIPGSGGSHKQGRSLASVSLRKSLNSRSPFHFNYFMIDFNQEITAVYGGSLNTQTKFLIQCIKKILSLYEKNENISKPKSVILIGHSYGGVLAKGVFTDPDLDPQSVQLIISLASPHKYPVIQFDSYITSYYKTLNDFWKNNSNVKQVNLFSIGGGNKDLLVRSDITVDNHSDFNVLTTSVPGVWLPNDHFSIMWCKQLIITIVRALFDSVDISTKQLSSDRGHITSVFHYHFIQRSAGKKYWESLRNRFTSFEKSPFWYENLQRQFTVTEPNGLQSNHYIMIRLYLQLNSEIGFIQTYNVNIKDWIYACTADVVYNSIRMCDQGENLSNMTEIAPVKSGLNLKRKFVYLNLFELKEKSFTHVIIRLPPSRSFMSVSVDVHRDSERNIIFSAPKLYSLRAKTIIETTADGALTYTISLVGFESFWQYYNLLLESSSCKGAVNNVVVSFMVPWANETQHFILQEKDLVAGLGLISPKPKNYKNSAHPKVRLHLDPTCKYKVKIQPSLIGMLSQGVRYCTLMLPAFMGAVLLLTLRQQLLFLDVNSKCSLFHSALSFAVRRYYVVLQVAIALSYILRFRALLSLLPPPDTMILQELNLDFFFMSILLYAVAIVLTYSGGAACYVMIVMSGQAAHKMALKFIARTVTGLINWSDWVISALHQVPFFVAILLISLSLSTCGAVSLWLGIFFYFLKLCKMYEDYLDDWFHYSINLIAKTVKKAVTSGGKKENSKNPEIVNRKDDNVELVESDQNSETLVETQREGHSSTVTPGDPDIKNEPEVDYLSAIHFHTSVFMVWLLIALLYVPCLLVWARDYPYSLFLKKDPSMIPGVIVSGCGAILWQSDVPKKCRKLLQFTTSGLFLLALISMIYASLSLYRLGFILSAGLTLLALNQALSDYINKFIITAGQK